MKKLLCLIISAIMSISVLVVNAADNTDGTVSVNSDFALLQKFDIVYGLEYEKLNLNDTVSKSTFTNYLLNIISDDKLGDFYSREALQKAEQQGLIVSAADVKDGQLLVADEAVAMAVRVAGYDVIAQESAYPQGYYSIAYQEDILKGLELSGNVTYEQMIKLLRNLLEAEHPEIERTAYGNNLNASKKWPVLEYYRDIYCIKGIITANADTSLYSTNSAGEGWIAIDGNPYKDESGNASALLGHKVNAYVQHDRFDEDIVLYVEDTAKNEIVIDADLIESVSDDLRILQYYQDETSNRTKKITIAPDAAFMLNGVSYSEISADAFTREGTKIVLVDNKSGEYDFVNLIYAETMIVSAVSASTQAIQGEYKFEGALSKLDLSDLYQEDISIYKNNAEIKIADIAIGDVLSVYRTETGKVKIIVMTNAFNGKVDSYSGGEQEVVIDGNKYELSELYQNALKNNEKSAQKIETGTSYTFRLDENGKIISVDFLASDSLTYGYVKSIWEDENTEEAGIKIFMEDGTWQRYEFADKVRWNGKRIKRDTILKNDEIMASVPGIIGLNFDKDKQINVLETPVKYYDGIDPKRLNTTGEKRYTFRWGGTSFSNHYYMDGATTVFIIPEDEENARESDYRITTPSNAFNNWSYTFTGYNRDEFFKIDMLVNKRSIDSIREVTGSYYMVKETGISIDENDEEVSYVSVTSPSYAGVTFYGESDMFDSVKCGDLIRLHFDSTGKADNVSVIVDADAEPSRHLPSDDERDGSASVVRGFALKTDPANGWILLDTDEEMAFKASATSSVLVFDGRNVSAEPFGSIEAGDYLIICMSGSTVSQVIVYR